MDKVICSKCNKYWKTNKGYLNHKCEKTGFKPTDPRHLGKRFLKQSKQRLKDGDSLNKDKEKEIEKMIKETNHEV